MTRPLRVAVLARAVMPLHGYGGLERSVHDLVRHLAQRDVWVTLIVPPPTAPRRGTGDDPFDSPRITLRHVPYLTFPLANRRGTTVLDRSTAYPLFGRRAGRVACDLDEAGEVDVVHAFGASGLGYARARRRGTASAPLVLNPQGLEEFGATGPGLPRFKRLGYWPLQRAVLTCSRAADAIIATDRALEPMVIRHLRPRAGQLHTIPNGIDLVSTSALAGPADGQLLRQRVGIGPGELLLLSVGRLEKNKGFDVLIEALAQAARPGRPLAVSGWRWVVVGVGPFRRDLELAVERLNLTRHVVFAGRVTEAELHAWHEAATVFVHPTRYEGSSLVTLEAMAHRKAVVGTIAGGLPDKVRPGVNGWLVEPGDPGALAGALEQAGADAGRLADMGRRGREIVEREFAWPVLAERHIALYRELVTRPRP